MDPTVWGPALWNVVFEVAAHAPRELAFELFDEMRGFIPCEYCRSSYRSYHAQLQPVQTVEALDWIWTVRDMVNQKLGKPYLPVSRLESRMAAFPHSVSPLTVFDVLLMLFRHATDPDAPEEALASLRRALPALRHAIHPASLREHLDDSPLLGSAEEAWQAVLAGKNRLLATLGEPVITEAQAWAQTDAARAPKSLHVLVAQGRHRRRRRL